MGINWTDEEFKEYKSKNIDRILKPKIKSKYKNIITEVDGIKFSSIKEAKYYQQLCIDMQNGRILGFCIQPTFILQAFVKYKADFIVFGKNETKVIEIKGYETQLWKTKKKLFQAKYPEIKLEIIK